jgi:hypothetical protein
VEREKERGGGGKGRREELKIEVSKSGEVRTYIKTDRWTYGMNIHI